MLLLFLFDSIVASRTHAHKVLNLMLAAFGYRDYVVGCGGRVATLLAVGMLSQLGGADTAVLGVIAALGW